MKAHAFDEHTELGTNFWGSDEKSPVSDWQAEVANDDTRLGYWDWVLVKRELAEDDTEEAEHQVFSGDAIEFTVPSKIKNQIRDELRAKGYETAADLIWLKHPDKLGSKEVEHTGGGCVAYITTYPVNGVNLIVAWTGTDGSDLPTDNDFMVGVYKEHLTEEQILLIESEPANS